MNIATITELDVRQLQCPMPIVSTKKAMKSMDVGERIRILATDPGSANDMESFCRRAGHALLEVREEQGVFYFTIEKG